MSGPAPAQQRRRRNVPARGDWKRSAKVGWQHGEIPSPGGRLRKATRAAWDTWFRAWFAAHWTPDDLPGLRLVARLYNAVEGGDLARAAELRLEMDGYGITPKGQQDRRWSPPSADEVDAEMAPAADEAAGPYGHLKVVGSA